MALNNGLHAATDVCWSPPKYKFKTQNWGWLCHAGPDAEASIPPELRNTYLGVVSRLADIQV